MVRYVGLLRGINVGGHKKIKMADLREMLAGLGFANVKTVLASGNAAWDADHSDAAGMSAAIMAGIETTFGFSAAVQVFPRRQVEELVAADPLAGVQVTNDTRLYVTFLPEPVSPPFALPYTHPAGDFTILRVTPTEVCSVLTLNKTRTVEGMKVLEEVFGREITTRNWNTVLKLAGL